MNIKLGISTCPNDTYIFGPMIKGFLESDITFELVMDDVEALNKLALENVLDIVKVSYGVVPKVLDNYRILKAGGALGFGCGPIVVSMNYSHERDLADKIIGVPGFNTTAFRIFKEFYSSKNNSFVELRFDKIIKELVKKKIDVGVLIHEGRFIYQNYGLNKICDLGEKWEDKYNAPIPLGAILVKKNLSDRSDYFNRLIRESIKFSKNNYNKIEPFIKENAQELDDNIIRQHIEYFVTNYSVNVTPAMEMLTKFIGCDSSYFV